MTGAALHYDLSGVDRLRERVSGLARTDRARLLDMIGATVESQTRRRIEEDKAGPDGTPWPAWSERYAATRHGGQSLLEGEGDLMDSLDYVASDDEVEVGSNLIYAAVHQFGSEDDSDQNIPARPYLGLSADDEAELEETIEVFFGEALT